MLSLYSVECVLDVFHLNDMLAGGELMNITLSMASEAAHIQQCAFSLPDGEKLIALWTNGEWQPDHPQLFDQGLPDHPTVE